MNIFLVGTALSDFTTAMSTLFQFFFTQLGNFTTWFVSDTLGQIILFTILATFLVYIFGYVISKIKG